MKASIAKGCPKVDVLSPLLCNLVMDNLWELNSDSYYTAGYADDITILINGNSLRQYQSLPDISVYSPTEV